MQWLKENRASIPSAVALLVVVVFWIVAAAGGLGLLHDASSPMAMLTGLYLMLALVAVSIIVAVLAATDLLRRAAERRGQRRIIR